MEKPKYKVMRMKNIRRLKPNGYSLVSTFSGCGGSCLGFRMKGFRVLYANEFIPEAQKVYKANMHPETKLDCRDIRKVKVEDILTSTGLKVGELDVFEGSPPCASFSTAGSREKGWGAVKQYSSVEQRVDDLFFEYARLLKGLQSKMFIAENVSGLRKGKAKGFFNQIVRMLEDCGYVVRSAELDAMWLGVPQARKRLIFIGVRKDFDMLPMFPKPLPYYYTVKDALPHIAEVKFGGLPDNWKGSLRPSPTIVQSGAIRSETAYFSGATYCKEADNVVRKFRIEEIQRLCGFPDDFELYGSYEEQWERLGRAVPPVMMSHIANSIKDSLDLINSRDRPPW